MHCLPPSSSFFFDSGLASTASVAVDPGAKPCFPSPASRPLCPHARSQSPHRPPSNGPHPTQRPRPTPPPPHGTHAPHPFTKMCLGPTTHTPTTDGFPRLVVMWPFFFLRCHFSLASRERGGTHGTTWGPRGARGDSPVPGGAQEGRSPPLCGRLSARGRRPFGICCLSALVTKEGMHDAAAPPTHHTHPAHHTHAFHPTQASKASNATRDTCV